MSVSWAWVGLELVTWVGLADLAVGRAGKGIAFWGLPMGMAVQARCIPMPY